MTSQKTIERCRLKVAELETTNKTLLENNLSLQKENKRLIQLENTQHEEFLKMRTEKEQCKQKCDIIIREKDQKIQEKVAYIQNLKDTIWHLKNSFECSLYRFTEIPTGFKFELEFKRKP